MHIDVQNVARSQAAGLRFAVISALLCLALSSVSGQSISMKQAQVGLSTQKMKSAHFSGVFQAGWLGGQSSSESYILRMGGATLQTILDTESPAQPNMLAIAGAGSDQLTLDWQPATDNVAVASYRVYRDGILVGQTSETTFTDTNLDAQQSYSYRVRAVDYAGNESADSYSLLGYPAPAQLHVVAPGYEGITISSYDEGQIEYLYDNNFNTYIRSKAVNPAVVAYTFDTPQRITAVRAGFVDWNGDSTAWMLEAANSQSDLDNATGSYQRIFDWQPPLSNIETKQLSPAVSFSHYRFTMKRHGGDNYVHIREVALLSDGPSVQKIKTDYKVMVIDYSHIMVRDYPGSEYKTINELLNQKDVDSLAATFSEAMYRSSGGLVDFEVVETFRPTEFPYHITTSGQISDAADTIAFTSENFDSLISNGYRNDFNFSYDSLVYNPQFDILAKVESGLIDAVWMFAPIGFGNSETVMVGKNAYWINGPAQTQIPINRRFVVYGFGLESHQGIGFMSENFAHMTENILNPDNDKSAVRHWPQKHHVVNWNTFNIIDTSFGGVVQPTRQPQASTVSDPVYFTFSEAVNFQAYRTGVGQSQVGISHYPPASVHNYDWNENHTHHWVGHHKPYGGGNWNLTHEYATITGANGGSCLLPFDGTIGTSVNGQHYAYPVPMMYSDGSLLSKVNVQTQASGAHAGVIFRVNRVGSDLSLFKGYYAGLHPAENKIALYKIDGSLQQLCEMSMPVESNRLYEIDVTTRGDTITVVIDGHAATTLSCMDATYNSGGFGVMSFYADAQFQAQQAKPEALTGEQSWYNYPDLSGEPRRTTPSIEWQGDADDNFTSNDYFFQWWYEHIPANPGMHRSTDIVSGKLGPRVLNNWWPYILDINTFTGDTSLYTSIIEPEYDTEAPAPPAGLTLSQDQQGVRISWQEPGDNIGVTRYWLYRNSELIKKPGWPDISYVDTGVRAGQSYTYELIAQDGSGNTSSSVSGSITVSQ